MTNFIYENAEKLDAIGEKCFGEAGSIEKASVNDIIFLQYIIAYRIYRNKRINPICYNQVKEAATIYTYPYTESYDIQIFFEKFEECRDDILYFVDVMKKHEGTQLFLKEYEKYREMAA